MRHRTTSVPLIVAAMSVVASLALPTAASASPGPDADATPRSGPRPATSTAADPRTLFVEDFEHGVATTPILLDQYVGAKGERYTADAAWIEAAQCNGIVISADSSDVPSCSSSDKLKALGDVLGQITGEDPQTNHVVSAWTSSRDLPADAVQIESLQPFSLGANGRFVSFGVSAAAGACSGYAHPLLDFLLVDGDEERPVSDRSLDPCTDERSKTYSASGQTFKGGEYVSSGGVLFSGQDLRWRLRNAQPSSSGNDAAIDRVTIVDSTPALVNAFAGSPVVGETARMTVRVRNTSEHGAKPGWSFAERLPDGLTVAADPATSTTCADPVAAVEAGASDIALRGDLAIDAADCTLSFGVTATEPGTYTITAADVSDAVGVDLPEETSVVFAPERNELAASERGVLSDGNDDDTADLGEQVAFTTTVENRGNVPVHDLGLSGEHGAVSCDTTTLALGESASCSTRPRAVTQDDLDRGVITDSVSVAATSRLGQAVSASASASVAATPAASVAELQVTPVGPAAPGVGDEIGLEALVRNTGNVSIRDITVTVDGTDVQVRCPSGALAPGATLECGVEGGRVVRQADLDRGSVSFEARLTAVDTAGHAVVASATAAKDTAAQVPSIGASLTAALDTSGNVPAAGDVVRPTATITNTGNVTLAGVTATVPGHDVTCADDTLAPGASVTCAVAPSALTQDDVDAGSVAFVVSVDASGPRGQAVTASDSTSVTVGRQHGLDATVSATLANSEHAPVAGDRVALGVAVRNSGNVTLRDLDARVDGRDLDVSCPAGPLAPGATADCAVHGHELTQQDVDRGSVTFGVDVSATAPGGRTAAASDEATVELVRTPAIAVSATSVLDANEHEVPLAGDTATVTMTVRNTGNVTVTGLRGQVTDREQLDVDCPSDELAPGESVTCTVSASALTQADVDRGQAVFDLRAAATGADRERTEASATTVLTIVRAPAIATTATATVGNRGDVTTAGDEVAVRLVVENTGNVTVRKPSTTVDGRPGMTATCDQESLAPGATTACALSPYELTQTDVDAGKVGFALTIGATGANDGQVTADTKTGLTIVRAPGVAVTVVGHLSESAHTVPRAGDRVTVAVRATNTGNVTLRDTSAAFVELADTEITCPADRFSPRAELACTVPGYVLTQGDLERGQVTLAAVLDAIAPTGATVSGRAEVHVGLTAESVLDVTAEPVVRDGSGETVLAEGRTLRPGDALFVRYRVTNTGNLAVDALQHADRMPEVDVDQSVLQPGETTTARTATAHVVTEEEAERGSVVLVGQLKGRVARGDGATSAHPGGPTTGQVDPASGQGAATTTGRVAARIATASAGPSSGQLTGAEKLQQLRNPVWVFSREVRTTVDAEPATAPLELAFTGTEVVLVALPASIVALLAGLVLLLWWRRRSTQRGDGRHRA